MRDLNIVLKAIALLAFLLLGSGCFGRSGVVGLAQADGVEGDPCRVDAQCEIGLVCINDMCAVSGASTPRPRPRDMGGQADVPPVQCAGLMGTLSSGESVEGITDEDHQYTGSCGGRNAPDEVWQLDLASPAFVLLHTEGSGDTDTVLYVRTECQDPSTEVQCNDDDYMTGGVHSRLELVLDAGRHFVVVDSFSAGGPYTLWVEIHEAGYD